MINNLLKEGTGGEFTGSFSSTGKPSGLIDPIELDRLRFLADDLLDDIEPDPKFMIEELPSSAVLDVFVWSFSREA